MTIVRQELQSVVLIISTKGVVKNDDFEACDNIFQTGHLISRNLVRKKFHSKDSKMLLTWIRSNRPAENGE